MCCCDCLLVIIAVFFPPFPVWVKRGLCSADSVINILLCILGYLPGLLHSWYIISRYPEAYYVDLDPELGQAGVIYVNPPVERAISPTTVDRPASRQQCLHQGSNGGFNPHYGATYIPTPTESPPSYDRALEERTEGSSSGKN
ncbi:BA75_02633T0 [Komagataella pastoris]|uniref:BA75_02633T0 n=1 Tax=Komagataella pastoris TaxID=4922 RepID=A0A1B2JEI8_PICPA|nr:BA75_02633T0 [Komagataella pastoris]